MGRGETHGVDMTTDLRLCAVSSYYGGKINKGWEHSVLRTQEHFLIIV